VTGRVVVTGSGGFIGAAVVRAFAAAGRDVVAWTRERGDLAIVSEDALARALDGAFAVLHLAGRAHTADAATLRRDNVDATARLAAAACRAGVARVIHVSSVKVNGECTEPGRPFEPDAPPAPRDAYARSKLDGERALLDALSGADAAATIVRLPLVYGPGAPANFAALVQAVRDRRVLPLGAIDNRRHLVSLGNVVDALAAALAAAPPVTGVHFIADADSVSTPQLVRAIAAALGVAPRLLDVPVPLLRIAGMLAGRRSAVDRLTRSLEVDAGSYTRATGWRPRPFHIDAATVGAGRGR
jgi:UDP-glucose 4-epimerase